MLFTLMLSNISVSYIHAQCAMCTLSADESTRGGNTQGKGLNKGILFLLGMPYIAVGAIGYLWYKKYRRKSADTVNYKQDPINLN